MRLFGSLTSTPRMITNPYAKTFAHGGRKSQTAEFSQVTICNIGRYETLCKSARRQSAGRRNNLDREKMKPLLSILIPTVPERAAKLSRLLASIDATGESSSREVLTLMDNRLRSIGMKRNALLEIACANM